MAIDFILTVYDGNSNDPELYEKYEFVSQLDYNGDFKQSVLEFITDCIIAGNKITIEPVKGD